MTEEDEKKTWMCSYIRILNIFWPMHITNEEIRTRAGIDSLIKQADGKEEVGAARSRP